MNNTSLKVKFLCIDCCYYFIFPYSFSYKRCLERIESRTHAQNYVVFFSTPRSHSRSLPPAYSLPLFNSLLSCFNWHVGPIYRNNNSQIVQKKKTRRWSLLENRVFRAIYAKIFTMQGAP